MQGVAPGHEIGRTAIFPVDCRKARLREARALDRRPARCRQAGRRRTELWFGDRARRVISGL